MNQLKSDLKNVFGFSNQNAETAIQLWQKSKLDKEFQQQITWLFYHPNGRMKLAKRDTIISTFNRLNYLISMGEIKC